MASPTKRQKPAEPVDYLSSLPDVVIVLILSFLDTKSAVITSFLSTRFKNLWTCLTNLTLDSHDFPKLFSFDKFVSLVLTKHDPKPNVCSITYERRKGKNYRPIIKVLNHMSAQDSGIEHVRVSGCLGQIGVHVSDLFDIQSLRSLHVENRLIYSTQDDVSCEYGRLKVPESYRLLNLTTLCLEGICFHDRESGDRVQPWSVSFVDCPNLVDLSLVRLDISGLKIFQIVCSNVEKLKLMFDSRKKCEAKVVLKVPKLTHFNLGGPSPIDLDMGNVPYLEVASTGVLFVDLVG